MDWQKVAKKSEGFQTVESIEKTLRVKRATAINYVYEMRKRGFVHGESRGRKGKRLYEIRPYKKISAGYPGLYEIINANSPIKVVRPYKTILYRKMSIEEAIVKAIETKNFRLILASLALFKKVGNWYRLYRLSKEAGVGRKVGALYDISRKYVRKMKRMDKRVENLLKETKVKSKYIVPRLRTEDFKEIEKKWNVYIPFNKEDLERYKE